MHVPQSLYVSTVMLDKAVRSNGQRSFQSFSTCSAKRQKTRFVYLRTKWLSNLYEAKSFHLFKSWKNNTDSGSSYNTLFKKGNKYYQRLRFRNHFDFVYKLFRDTVDYTCTIFMVI